MKIRPKDKYIGKYFTIYSGFKYYVKDKTKDNYIIETNMNDKLVSIINFNSGIECRYIKLCQK